MHSECLGEDASFETTLPAQEISDLHSRLRRLSRGMAPFRPADVLATTGALQLIPTNAHCALRLETLAHLAVSRDVLRGRTVQVPTVEEWCNHSELTRLVADKEDRCENLFTQSFTFFGGSFTIFPGIESEPAFVLRALLTAIFLMDEDSLLPLCAIARTVRGALAISDAIAHRTHLPRGIRVPHLKTTTVKVPIQKELSRLKAALIWDERAIRHVLKQHDTFPEDLNPLTLPIGTVAGTVHDLQNGVLLRHPFVRCGSELVVPIPSAIPVGLRYYILRASK